MKSATLAISGFVFSLLLLLTGCGGSGGGVSVATLTYSTDWTNYQAATGGKSEIVTLTTSSGALVNSFVLNQGTTTLSTATFPSLAAGTYHLGVKLYSATGGTLVGQFDAAVSLPQTTSVRTAVGDIVSSIQVTPATASVAVQANQQFYAAGYAAGGIATFLPPNSVTWSVLGSQGSVDGNGLFLGLTPGACSVQASEAATGFNAAATVTVTPVSATAGTWTVMVYMNAANDLSSYSLPNFLQMQSVATAGTTTRTVVQWKQVTSLPYPAQFNGTRRYLIQPSKSQTIASQLVQDLGTGVDMGNPQTLTDFINWAKTYYPAQHYALVVWDHGSGWQQVSPQVSKAKPQAVSFDTEFGTSIQTWQLSQALGNNSFDILAWDASLLQMVEIADEIRSKVSFVVGSEESPPAAGYPYDLILSQFYNSPNSSALTLSHAFVDGMITEYGNSSEKITQSVVDTSKFPALLTAINDLGAALSTNVGSIATDVQTTRQTAQGYNLSATQFYYDLSDVSSKLDAGTTIPTILAADAEVRTAVSGAVVYEKHNAASPGSHGIAIDFSPASVFVSYASQYSQLRLSTDTDWETWLNQAP